jgi:phenylalanyl-tRNA synthetase beta chain
MKFTLSWLKEYLATEAGLAEITQRLTAIGLEVEGVENRAEALAPFKVAEIVEAEKHPNADKLKRCKVNTGSEVLQIVCGAANARAGLKVVLAPIGSVIPTNGMKIKQSKIRDVESNGMLCSASELGLGTDGEGIIELPASAKVGESFVKAAGLDDPVIEIAITPNRADCLGVYGIARDLAAAGLGALKPLDFTPAKAVGTSKINVTISDQAKCPAFIGRFISGVKNGPSPEWLQNRLKAIGAKPISALVDITNYLTLAFGRPAHVYDAAKLKGGLNVRLAKKGEALAALDHNKYPLDDTMLVIADGNGPVALGGIIGGEPTGCSDATTDVFLEIALFDPVSVAQTGRKLQINSDARYRFERHVDPGFAKAGAELATNLIIELCGGQASELVMAGRPPEEKRTLIFNPKKTQTLAAVEISDAQAEKILAALGFSVSKSGSEWKVTVPTWRADVEGEPDVVEEIVRIHGYEHIPTLPLTVNMSEPALSPAQSAIAQARRQLAAQGLHEVVTFSFMDEKQAHAFGARDRGLTLKNPISAELATMRPSILPNLISASVKNAARGIENLRLFEIGPVFEKASTQGQKLVASGIRSGSNHAKTVYGTSRPVDAFDVKADALAAVEPYLPPSRLSVTRGAPAWYHPGRSGTLVLGKTVVGYFGEIHPAVLKSLDADFPVAGFELFLEQLPQPRPKKNSARGKLELSNFQAVERDFAFTVDRQVSAESVLEAARSAEKILITEVRLFDVYSGKGIEDGKKSIAFAIRLEPKDHTLTDAEIEQVSKKVIESVEKATGGNLRK